MKQILLKKTMNFYSYLDEESFFAWLKSITAVEDIKGSSDGLTISFHEEGMDEESLRDLLAIFARYELDMKQFSIFLNESNKHWFHDNSSSYWYKKVWD